MGSTRPFVKKNSAARHPVEETGERAYHRQRLPIPVLQPTLISSASQTLCSNSGFSCRQLRPPSRTLGRARRICKDRWRRLAWNPMGRGSEKRWTYRRLRHRRFLLARGEEEGSIESKGEISGVKSTLKPVELHCVVAILAEPRL